MRRGRSSTASPRRSGSLCRGIAARASRSPLRSRRPRSLGRRRPTSTRRWTRPGHVYVAFSAFPACCTEPASIWVTRSLDDDVTWAPFIEVVGGLGTVAHLPNTTFRDGILEHFAASPTYPGHLYLVYEAWDGTQMDVNFAQSTDGGLTWSAPITVNDNVDAPGMPIDQFQPQVAAGPGGAVAVNFYDRRLACPDDPSVRTLAERTSASTSPCRRTRTPAAEPCPSGGTCASRSSPGIRSSPARRSEASTSTPAPDTEIPVRLGRASSATTSGSRSRRRTSTACSSPPTIPRP